MFVQIYTLIVGLTLLVGTVLTFKTINRVASYRKPIYVLKACKGIAWVATFVLGSARWVGLVTPANTILYSLWFSIFLSALSLIAEPLVDRYELKRLGSPQLPRES